jgi:menaquinol-cytochrome c reductase cytochrome b/c subunit
MKEQEKKETLEKYQEAKKKGVPFFPDIIFSDAIVSFGVFLLLIALAYFLGAPLEARANPADTTYTPRPEWYFLFLFQLLKYFPGKLEVVGVIIIPTLAILVLFLLPFLDRGTRRHFLDRPLITGVTLFAVVAVGFLTIQASLEAPPPVALTSGDQTAALYAANCASCHGDSIVVPSGTNLHDVIAQGKHEGMPAWGSDLSTDQIDALVGFILSPGGSALFTQNCGACHAATDLVAINPLELKKSLDEGATYAPHANLTIPDWSAVMTAQERTRLLNFLVAPDGARLFAVNCSPCHGESVAFSGSETDLRTLISQGGLHLEMPPWKEKLTSDQINALSLYVVDPAGNQSAKTLFDQNCATCHGSRIPVETSVDLARQAISAGGAHQTMPIWGQILTSEQLDALVQYTFQAAQGSPLQVGQGLFAQNCASCHGEFGQGGPNPSGAGGTIPPISTASFLQTRDDTTIRAIIAQGQSDLGMPPFGSASGGLLSDDEIDAIVAFVRSWEANPLVIEPAPAPAPTPIPSGLSSAEIYANLCAQCHGPSGEGGSAPALNTPDFQQSSTDKNIFDAISNLDLGYSPMIAWGKLLSPDQITHLVQYIRGLSIVPSTTPAGGTPTFDSAVLPILAAKCSACHGSLGGWTASSYSGVMTTGTHGPVIIPGDAANSLLVQKLQGTQQAGSIMPPTGKLSNAEIQVIIDWINAGALEK